MLSQSFLASVGREEGDQATKEAGVVHLQELRPTPAIRSTFKKCNTIVNGLAASASHVFAAPAEKAVVHVYSREGRHQEATVPFPERIHSLTFAGDDGGGGVGLLVLGTQGGRVIVWEVGGNDIHHPRRPSRPSGLEKLSEGPEGLGLHRSSGVNAGIPSPVRLGRGR